MLNSFLQMIERDQSTSLILAATNHPEILDYALFRRFDDVIRVPLADTAAGYGSHSVPSRHLRAKAIAGQGFGSEERPV